MPLSIPGRKARGSTAIDTASVEVVAMILKSLWFAAIGLALLGLTTAAGASTKGERP
jgi:hypothetical protein